MTFSIVAYDPDTGDLGVVVSTARLAVGSRVPYVEAGVGAVATQSVTNSALGSMVLDLLRTGHAPDAAVASAIASDPGREERQVAAIDIRGRTGAWTGDRCKEWRGHVATDNAIAAGNIIVSEAVLTESLRAFRESGGELRDRLLAAYAAGQEMGGDRGGVQSAALRVARINTFPFIDLRVDDHPSPVDELHRLARLAEGIVPRLPRLRLAVPPSVMASEPFEAEVTCEGDPVAGIQLTANGALLGETDPEGRVFARIEAPGDYYLAAAEPPTPTRAPASYRYAPAVAWLGVIGQ